MKRNITVAASLFFLLLAGILISQEAKIRIAITSFDTLTFEADSEKLGNVSAGIVENKVAGIDRFQVRKRGDIQDYIDKLQQAQLGLSNPDSVKGMAKSLKVDYLTVGSVYKFGTHCEVDARAVNIDDWTIVHSAGCNSFSADAAADFNGQDIMYTFTKENLDKKEKEKAGSYTVEVFEFKDDTNLSEDGGYGEGFAEILNSELGALNNISVIERTHSKALIMEKSLEMAGIIENDKSFDVFRKRNVQYMLRGNIKSFKDVICINYEVRNTSNRKLVYMEHREIGSIKALRPLARSIAKQVEDALNNKIGTLSLTTKPSKANLVLDDAPAGMAPLLMSLSRGKHTVKVSLPGYETVVQEIDIKPKKINKITIKMPPISTKLLKVAAQYEKRKDYKTAVQKYQEFIDQYNETREANQAYYRMGHVMLINLKNYSDALKTFQTLVNRYPDAMTRAEAYFGMANTYLAMGNRAKARETISYIIEKYPETFAAEEAKMRKNEF